MVYSTRRFVVCLSVCRFVLVFFLVLLVLRLPRLGKRELILVLFVLSFGLCLFRFVGFLFLLGSGKGCGLWLWHSLDFSLTFFYVWVTELSSVLERIDNSNWQLFFLWLFNCILPVFSLNNENLMSTWLYQFLSSLISFSLHTNTSPNTFSSINLDKMGTPLKRKKK